MKSTAATTTLAVAPTQSPTVREWVAFSRRLARRRTALFGLVVVLLVLLTSLAAPWLTSFNPVEQTIGDRLKPPGWRDQQGQLHPLGTDHLGRDLLARVLFGARPALLVGAAAGLLSGVLGLVTGLLSGDFGGRPVDGLMRMGAGQLALPPSRLAIAVIGVLGPSLPVSIVVSGVSSWVSYARVVPASVLSPREREFVPAAHALGGRDGRTLIRHILPNVLTPWLVV